MAETGVDKRGKVDPRGVLIIDGDVELGEKIAHEGPILIEGSVAENAHIESLNGGVTIRGDLGNKATVRSILDQQTNRIGGSGGIRVKGATGDDVVLDTDGRIRLDTAGDRLTANAGMDFKAAEIGKRARIDAGTDILVLKIGAHAERIDSGRDIQADEIGPGGFCQAVQDIRVIVVKENNVLRAGRDLDTTYLEAEVRADVANHVYARSVGEDCIIKAGGNMTLNQVDPSARLEARGRIESEETPVAGEKHGAEGARSLNFRGGGEAPGGLRPPPQMLRDPALGERLANPPPQPQQSDDNARRWSFTWRSAPPEEDEAAPAPRAKDRPKPG